MSLVRAVVLASVLLPMLALAEAGDEAKTISGMSIIGNNEAPTSLIIVPWKASSVGYEPEFASSLLDDSLVPVDREVFMRELRFYELSNP
ncbi:hypothetical protein CAI21_17200 [Alkalilimnicola ehrlichii]|uniref:Uncharacterized protein n=1 Tax=Alkalilimnicola ehrlichii TaxID=351052 RepID=A0A3E0WJS7_9GAMM|nr:hypothetical protein [Alkalilimnicola ehrlichii]RFA26220.1 hypothetical protein CAI21_17200 [Alkalilimnicola ehrlichii]RFA33204.1 hypothetical protein CAL65_17680 [Alkalilimnicola ehrlichii]